MTIRIGTAGWAVPRAISEAFPTGGSVLERYAACFDCVEINSSFYRPHRRTTYERWAAATPDHFRFATKVPKTITHDRRLIGCDDEFARFLGECEGLGAKSGPLLVQLPPSLTFNARVAGDFFCMLRASSDAFCVCEPRHATWFTDEAESLLKDFLVARVAADPAITPDARRFGGWDGLRYLRLHGSPKTYYSTYDAPALQQTAAQIRRLPTPIWCIFDNTALGCAAANALALKAMLVP